MSELLDLVTKPLTSPGAPSPEFCPLQWEPIPDEYLYPPSNNLTDGQPSHTSTNTRQAAVNNLLSRLKFPEVFPIRGDEPGPPSVSPLDTDPQSEVHTPAEVDNIPGPMGSLAEEPAVMGPDERADAVGNNHSICWSVHQNPNHSSQARPQPTRAGTVRSGRRHTERTLVMVKKEGSESAIPLSTQPLQQPAYAKIEFDDGYYFMQTMAVEFGRDQRRLKTAEEKLKHHEASGSREGGLAGPSGDPIRATGEGNRFLENQVVGSVVSEQGGICGFDEEIPDEEAQETAGPMLAIAQSGQSGSSVVNPADLHVEPPREFDYEGNAREHEALGRGDDDEIPAAVTTNHLPPLNIHDCPLIPIHPRATTLPEEINSLKAISRRHIRIEWEYENGCFMLYVNGRNGVFVDNEFLHRYHSRALQNGSRIQLKHVNMTFRLPHAGGPPDSEGSDDDEDAGSPSSSSSSVTSSDVDKSSSSERRPKKKRGITPERVPHPQPLQLAEGLAQEGPPMPPKKRGPGRPPKDGISSTRQKREEARRLKEAQAKAENGGVTPPPSNRAKQSQASGPARQQIKESKGETRKYTKRKNPGDNVLPSIEDEEDVDDAEDGDNRALKRARKSKSPSPEYPPLESLSKEQLQKPQEPYAQQLYSLLLDCHPRALTLRQIYRAMKLRWPYYRHEVDTIGWQSSVRHNLNNHQTSSFVKGKKEGKGFFWTARPGQPPKNDSEKKRQAPQQNSGQKARSDAPNRPHNQQGQVSGQWHPHFAGPPPNGIPNQFGSGPQTFQPPLGQQWLRPPHYPNSPRPPSGQGGPQPNPADQTVPPQNQQNMRPFADQTGQLPLGVQSLQAGVQPAQQSGQPPGSRMVRNPLTPMQNTSIPPPSNVGRGPPNMPCSLDGLDTIGRFEKEILSTTENNHRARLAFQSARARALHGLSRPQMHPFASKEEEDKFLDEEKILFGHLQEMIRRFPNPAFVGFSTPGSGGAASSQSSAQNTPDASR